MRSRGIYTLANDTVYDQLVALLNSIEANISPDLPVCVIPYNNQTDWVAQEVATRPNVSLFQNWDAIQRWERFAQQVWDAHPIAQTPTARRVRRAIGHHRKFVAFDGPFEQFIFYDADSLAMKSVDAVFERLQSYDFVFDDWEHAKPNAKTALDLDRIAQTGLYTEDQIRPRLHCSSFFASKQGIFDRQELLTLQTYLIQHQEVAWIPRWWDDAFLFNYLTLRSDRPQFNCTLSPDSRDRTGNCADSDPFVQINHVLYNEEGLKPIHRLHYMNYPAISFTQLSQGKDADVRYKDIFLHYRFLKHPNQKPKFLKPPTLIDQASYQLHQVTSKLRHLMS